MTTAEDEVRQAVIVGLMNGSQADRDKFIIATLFDLKENGCARACKETDHIERWTPAAVATALSGVAMAVLEYIHRK